MDTNDQGNIHVSDKILSEISELVLRDIEGVAKLSGRLSSELIDVLGNNLIEELGTDNIDSGIIIKSEEGTVLDIYLYVKEGYQIVDVAREVQEKVFCTIKNMTDIEVKTINVHVDGMVIE
jgi:uncharacterized alkaline shock family protein YloU